MKESYGEGVASHAGPESFVRVPAGAQSAPGGGCADGWDHDEEGELGARRRYPWVLRHPRPRVAGEVRRAPRGGPARRATHPEMAERRRAGGGHADTERGRDGAGREHQPAAGQSLPALRVRSLGRTVEKEAGARRGRGRALRRRLCEANTSVLAGCKEPASGIPRLARVVWVKAWLGN